MLLLAALEAVRIAAHVWILPPYIWDALDYRLPKVAEWVQRGAVQLFETPTSVMRWPAGHELLQTWFVLFPHHDVLVDAASVPAYVLAIASTYAIACALGVSRMLAGFAALAYAYTPAVALHAATVNNDLPVAAVYLFMLALLVNAREAPTRSLLTVLTLALTLAVGVKAYVLFLAPGLLVVALSPLGRRHLHLQ